MRAALVIALCGVLLIRNAEAANLYLPSESLPVDVPMSPLMDTPLSSGWHETSGVGFSIPVVTVPLRPDGNLELYARVDVVDEHFGPYGRRYVDVPTGIRHSFGTDEKLNGTYGVEAYTIKGFEDLGPGSSPAPSNKVVAFRLVLRSPMKHSLK